MKSRLEGADKFLTQLRTKAKYEDVKNTVKLNGSELQKKMQRNASFIKGYQTGTTKRSVSLSITDGDLVSTVAPTTEYAGYLEYGTRFMSAQPFIGPSYQIQKPIFLSDLKRLVE